jgi:hypothetical protein
MALLPTHRPLRPLTALGTPGWLAALAVLALNDHVLKGAGLLPGVVTGKLSDFAGLLVAPALLATLAGVRSPRAWAACHVAVGLVFAAIQLSAGAASGWSALMSTVGFPWRITRDPTDLVALPVLAVSWRWLGAAAIRGDARREVAGALRWAGAGAGLWACMATSPPPRPGPDSNYASFEASIYLHNESDEEITVRVRTLRVDLESDCDALAADAGRIPDLAFGDALTWRMPERTNVPVSVGDEAMPCSAALVDGDGIAPAVLFWRADQVPVLWTPGQVFDESEHHSGGVAIEFDDAGIHVGYRSVGLEVVFERAPEVPEQPAGCADQSDADRIDWTTPVPTGIRRIERADLGPDGCVALELATAAQVDAGASGDPWYLCIPAQLWGPGAGQWVMVSTEVTQWYEAITVELRGDQGAPLAADRVRLQVSRGDRSPDVGAFRIATEAREDCQAIADDGCAVLAVGRQVRAWEPGVAWVELPVGEATVLPAADGSSAEIAIVHAQHRALLDPTCTEGTDATGEDLEIAAVIREP